MKRRLGWAAGALMVFGAAVAGCGGGGGSSASNNPTLATKIRILQAGDQWVYNVTGQGLGDPAVTATGTITDTIARKPFNGGTALAMETVTHATVTNGPPIDRDTTVYFSQDSTTGDILELGEQDSPTNSISVLVNPAKIIFGSWSNGETLTSTLDFGGGDVQTIMKTITGSGTDQTPAGSFAVWTVVVPPSGNLTFTQDWAPQLGAPIKITGSFLDTTLNSTAVLQSTTVPH